MSTQCPTCGGSGVVNGRPIVIHGGIVEPGQRFRFKRNRGIGTYTVTAVVGERITLRDHYDGKVKTIGVPTLRGDYERVDA